MAKGIKSHMMTMAVLAAMSASMTYDDRERRPSPEPESRDHKEYRKTRAERRNAERAARKKNRK